jgi:glycyl-tRNA synthetase beta chain
MRPAARCRRTGTGQQGCRLEVQLAPLFAAGDFQQALTVLAGLRDVVDTFFEKVMVMAEDEALRLNA